MDLKRVVILAFSACFFTIPIPCYSNTDTIRQGTRFNDWDKLVSSNNNFTLQFFSLGNSRNRYLGIFYNADQPFMLTYTRTELYGRFPEGKAVWVANRDNPIPDTSGNLVIDGNLSISYNMGGSTILLFHSAPGKANKSATLLDSGNFVLQELNEDGSVKRVLWQSFDYPTDTLLRGMKLGIDLKTGHKWSLTCWMSDVLPASGSITLEADPNGTSQLVMFRRGKVHWISGPWLHDRFQNSDPYDSHFSYNETEKYFTYSGPHLTITPDALLTDMYLMLGICDREGQSSAPGCVEYDYNTSMECRKPNEYFERRQGEIYGINHQYAESYNLSLYDCQQICWNNCSCTAFTYTTEDRTGCNILTQITATDTYSSTAQASEYYLFMSNSGKKKKWIWLIIGMGSFSTLLLGYLI